MSKIQIALVGGQIIPVYRGIIAAADLDEVVLICSKSTEQEASRIASAVADKRKQQKFKELPITAAKPIDPIMPDEILTLAQELATTYANDDVYINISSGTKPWSFYFVLTFANHPSVHFFYIDQNGKYWDLTSEKSTQLNPLPLTELFHVLGNKPKMVPLTKYTEEDFIVASQIAEIRACNIDAFRKLTVPMTNEAQRNIKNTTGRIQCGDDGELQWNRGSKTVEVSLRDETDLQYKKWQLKSQHVVNMIFNTHWFEIIVAGLLSSRWQAKDIYVNCVFPAHNNKPKNEIDIIVAAGEKILFVECKTQITKPTDIDKFKNAAMNFGGLGTKTLFVTEESIYSNVKEKCHDSGVPCFSLKDWDSAEDVTRELFALLDKKLYNINSK